MTMRSVSLALVVAAIASLASADVGGPSKPTGKPIITASGLRYYELTVGSGATAQSGDIARVHYTGWLTDGRKFDSSYDHGQPLRFWLGKGNVIAGWDEGVVGMRVGGKRQLLIPAKLGYGAKGTAGIPPNADLVFEVELVGLDK
jgi:FKBP-type peptidyl-prolyl cis-trans isomerase